MFGYMRGRGGVDVEIEEGRGGGMLNDWVITVGQQHKRHYLSAYLYNTAIWLTWDLVYLLYDTGYISFNGTLWVVVIVLNEIKVRNDIYSGK